MFTEKRTELPKHQEWDHAIELEPGAQLRTGPIYQMSLPEQKAIKEYIEENLKRGFIRPSKSQFGSPVLFVPKKDGKLRLCVDYRQLNKVTIKNKYLIPLISELQDKICGAIWFTKLDQVEGYTAVCIKIGDEWKTAFRTAYGQYEYLILPFGLTNAPATFQQLNNEALADMIDQCVLVYLDNIIIYTKGSRSEHFEKVKEVLRHLKKKGLLLKTSKCEFAKEQVTFLGAVITRERIRMDPDKIRAILEWPIPRRVRDIQAFLGLTNYYQRFVKKYSDLSTPLTDMTRKNQEFHWQKPEEEAFKGIKRNFKEDKILATANPEKPYNLETDVSNRALGVHLS